MSTVHIATTFGLGGLDTSLPHENLLEVVTASDESGTWVVTTCDGSGAVLDERPGTDDEVAQWTAPVVAETPPDQLVPSMSAAEAEALRSQVAALQAALDGLRVALGPW